MKKKLLINQIIIRFEITKKLKMYKIWNKKAYVIKIK